MMGLLIFDGDDTLWITEPLYDAARIAAGRIVQAIGLNAAEWDALQREIDVANVTVLGLSPDRFPTSCVQAADRLALATGKRLNEDVRHAIWMAAAEVFEQPAPLAPHAQSTLKQLGTTHRLALLTKGDRSVQLKRIADSGLRELFDTVDIVDVKTCDSFLDVVAHFKIPADETWSIGNSLRSDIQPALEAGLHGILVDAHVWEYERFDTRHMPVGVPLINGLDELPGVLAVGAAAESTCSHRTERVT